MSELDPTGARARSSDAPHFQQNTEFLRRIARGLLQDVGRVEDALQEAWLVARRNPTASRGWLAGVVRRVSSQMRRGEGRRRRREERGARTEALPSAADSVARLELTGKLVERVRGLDEPYRTVILLRYFDDLSAKEIAERRSVPLASVRTQLRRGLERLRAQLLAEEDSTPEAWLSALLPLAGPSLSLPLPIREGTSPSGEGLGPTVSAPTAGSALTFMNSSIKVAAGLALVLGGAFAVWETFRAEGLDSLDPGAVTEESRPGELPPARAQVDPLQTELPLGPAESERREGALDAELAEAPGDWVVRGTVQRNYEDGYPGAPLRVRLWHGYETEGEPQEEHHIVCAADGTFELALDDPERTVSLRVDVPAEDHYHWRAGDLVVRGDQPRPMIVHAFPFDCTLVGLVRRPDGTPVPGAEIQGTGESATSDASGRYRLPMPSGVKTHFVSARAPGLFSKRLVVDKLEPGEEREFEVEVRPDFRIAGTIVDDVGRPVQGARVSTFFSSKSVVSTDGAGEFELGGLDPDRDRHTLVVRKEGFLLLSERVDTTAEGEARAELTLERGVSVGGFVVDEDGAPVPGAELYIGFDPSALDRVDAVAHDDGSYEFPTVASGSQTLVVQRRGFAPHSEVLELPAAGELFPELTITLGAAHHIAGRVLDEAGRPRVGANVSMRFRGDYLDGRTQTDEAGRFRVDGLPAQDLEVELWGRGLVRTRIALEGVDREDYEFTVPGAGRLEGRVVDGTSGAPVSAFKVRFVDPVLAPGERRLTGIGATWVREGHAFDDEEGRWSTAGAELTPGDVIGVEVHAPGYAVARLEHVVVPPPAEPLELVTALVPGVSVLGSVLDAASGAPIEGASVRAYPGSVDLSRLHGGDPHGPSAVLTDARGEFLIENAPLGEVKLLVEHEAYPVLVDGPFEVLEGTREARRRIAMARGARILGLALDAEGQVRANQSISLILVATDDQIMSHWSATTDAEGRFEFERLPAGVFLVAQEETRGDTHLPVLSVDLELGQGEQRELELRPSGSGRLKGRLVCAEGLPQFFPLRMGIWDPATSASASLGSGAQYHGTFAVDGEFELRGLAPGTYRLNVHHTNWKTGENWRTTESVVVIVAPGEPVELDVVLVRTLR